MKKLCLSAVLYLFLPGCFLVSPTWKTQQALKKRDCAGALKFFRDIKARHSKLTWAKKAQSICLSAKPKVALWFLRYLSLYENTKERLFWTKKHADTAFEKVKDYEQALVSYSVLKEQAVLPSEKSVYTVRMARSYFERGKWESALREIQSLLKKEEKERGFSASELAKALFLKARIHLMQEEYLKAEKEFQQIQALYPLYFKEQEMFLYLSFIYEERKDFHKALEELKAFQHSSAFLKQKMNRLKIRQKNQPGAIIRAL